MFEIKELVSSSFKMCLCVFSELRSSLVDDKDEVEDENLFDIELLGLDMILTSSESCCSEQIVGVVKLLEINQLPTVSRQTDQ